MSRPIPPKSRTPRPSRRIHDTPPDKTGKLRELAECPDCRASYRNGRWTWERAPVGSYEHVCPACERIRGDYPAGVLRIQGGFANSHRDELVGLIRNVEERERREHPLKRVMAIEEEGGGLEVKTTDAKLAESLGKALHHAYAGTLEQPPTSSDKENLVRVRWTRD
jgi:NMD protein affecting ribosome stability and mRNA decay